MAFDTSTVHTNILVASLSSFACETRKMRHGGGLVGSSYSLRRKQP